MNDMILMNNFSVEPAALRQEMLAAVQQVFESGWYILGNEVASFEKKWAKKCGTKYCVGVASGLDAIEIGLRALGIGASDEVITTAMTAYATILAIQRIGALPVFADIHADTACLDPVSVERCISDRTKAVLVVHIYGQSADLESLAQICSRHKVYLVEDCAQAHGARNSGKSVGSHGVLGAWSFYPTKNLGTIGDAGAVTTNDKRIAERILQLRNYGQVDRYHHGLQGMNSRLDELHAAILQVRLKYLNEWTKRRRKIANIYWDSIENPLLKLLSRPGDSDSHVHHLFVLRTKNRNVIQDTLQRKNIATLIHYPIPATEQKALKEFRQDSGGLLQTQRHCRECLSLPIHPFLTDKEIKSVISSCNALTENISE